MTKKYKIVENKFGFLLTGVNDENDKMVLYKTKLSNSKTPYYVKEVKPNEVFLSGLFFDKKKQKYIGKLTDNSRITLELTKDNYVIMETYNTSHRNAL